MRLNPFVDENNMFCLCAVCNEEQLMQVFLFLIYFWFHSFSWLRPIVSCISEVLCVKQRSFRKIINCYGFHISLRSTIRSLLVAQLNCLMCFFRVWVYGFLWFLQQLIIAVQKHIVFTYFDIFSGRFGFPFFQQWKF